MAPEEWPIAAPAADRTVTPARLAGRGRLATVRRDFFLNPDERLSEQERALMTAMLHALILDIADELRAALPATSAVANDDDNSELVTELSAAGLLDDSQLIELLLRRAGVEQIASAVKARNGRREGRLLQSLVSDDNASISAAAMALILARGRRKDRFGQTRLEFDDLPAEVAVGLAHATGAALRRRLVVTLDPHAADRMLASAIAGLLARHDEDRRFGALTAVLVRLLDENGKLEEDLIATDAEEGEIALAAQALAHRAGILGQDAMNMLVSGSSRGLMLLLRMAAMSREFAARLLAGPGDLLGVADAGREITRFDTLTQDEVDGVREWLRLDPAYRTALAALGQGHGQRSL